MGEEAELCEYFRRRAKLIEAVEKGEEGVEEADELIEINIKQDKVEELGD